jgi:hypothetical protein
MGHCAKRPSSPHPEFTEGRESPPASFAILVSAALSASMRAAETGQSGLRIALARPGDYAPVSLTMLPPVKKALAPQPKPRAD